MSKEVEGGTVKLPRETWKWIEDFIKSEEGRKRGFTSIRQVVLEAIRHYLDEVAPPNTEVRCPA